MDQYQRIAFVIAVISGAGFLAYVAADDIFLSFAQKHWREDKRCGKGAPSLHKQQRRQSAIQQVVSSSHLLSCHIHFLSGSEPCCNHLHGYCGHTTDHCLCLNCKNYHFLFLHVLAILFGLALTGIIAGGMIAFGIYKYKNWTAEKQRAVARDKEEKRRKEEEKNEAEV